MSIVMASVGGAQFSACGTSAFTEPSGHFWGGFATHCSSTGSTAHHCAVQHRGHVPTFFDSVALWVVMATAMMLPTTLPAARSIALTRKWKRRRRGQALFAVGYCTVWSAVGVVVLFAVWLIGPKAIGALTVSVGLAVAAAWESTRWKRTLLQACQRVRSLPPDGSKADRACVREGIRNGVRCAGSCGPMMVPMALAPHSIALLLMLFLSAVVAAEKLLTKAVDHLRPFAAALGVAAIVVAAYGVLVA
jgi:predicted metal-binding membrane protein